MQLKARLKDCGGIEGWQKALEMVAKSPFLMGKNGQGWRADFDFLMKKGKFLKIMEGGYGDNRAPLSEVMQELASISNRGQDDG